MIAGDHKEQKLTVVAAKLELYTSYFADENALHAEQLSCPFATPHQPNGRITRMYVLRASRRTETNMLCSTCSAAVWDLTFPNLKFSVKFHNKKSSRKLTFRMTTIMIVGLKAEPQLFVICS